MSCWLQLKFLSGHPLFVSALLSSLAWYLFWVVMAPVEKDIAHIFNWFFFMKLGLDHMYDVYGLLACVHHWIPLVIISVFILSKVSPVLPSLLERLAQVTYVIVVLYNSILFLYLLVAGGKVTALFRVTLPLRLVLSLGPWVSALLLPHTLFIPLTLVTGAHLLLSLCCCQTDSRNKMASDRPRARVVRRLLVTLGPLLFLLVLGWCVMYEGCVPCDSVYGADVPPPPPRLIAHRGCGENFPENSLAAFKRAVLIPRLYGLETDIQVSSDGIVFLLHDPHLSRTTDVRERCLSVDPLINASTLGYSTGDCPLGELNVGSWYNKRKLGLGQEDLRALFAQQKLPTFSDYLQIAKHSGKVIMFDLMRPPVGHTHHSHYMNITLETIVKSGIPLNKVWWLPKHNRAWVIQNYPGLSHITKTIETPFKDFPAEHIERVNDDWTTPIHQFRAYQAANISINMYFVDSPFMYNYAWCLGIQTVTTDHCQELADHTTNDLYKVCRDWQVCLHESAALYWWTGVSLLTLLLIILIFWEKLLVWR